MNRRATMVPAIAAVVSVFALVDATFAGEAASGGSTTLASRSVPGIEANVAPSPLLAVDQNRASIVEGIVASWKASLRAAYAEASPEAEARLRDALDSLRADRLLSASLAGTLEGLGKALAAPEASVTLSATTGGSLLKALGDANRDLVYTPVTPCRIVDTRAAGVGVLLPQQQRDWLAASPAGNFAAQGGSGTNCGIAVKPAAVLVNVTIAESIGGPDFLFAWPYGQARPLASSTINWSATGQQVANAVVIPLCGAGCASDFSTWASGQTHLVIDVLGYFNGAGDASGMDLFANGQRVMRFEYQPVSPNVIGGSPANAAGGGGGATVAGGGAASSDCYEPTNGQSTRACANLATASWAAIGGGVANQASATGATIAGGSGNTASGLDSTVAGGKFHRASGDAATVGGGNGNSATGFGTTIGGGLGNRATTTYSVVAGGVNNFATGDYSAIGGGRQHSASAYGATIAGGHSNVVTGPGGTVAGGGFLCNDPPNCSSFLVGGNQVAGSAAMVPGGLGNRAGGALSFAAGRRARVRDAIESGDADGDQGTFLWADAIDRDFVSTGPNEFAVRATGAVRFVLGVDAAGNATYSCAASNGNAWACSSDRAVKENFVEAEGRWVLSRLATMPLYFWNAKGADPSVRHLGPTAQDLMRAFGVGSDDRMIGMQDADGVALAAIQGLFQVVQEKDREIDELRKRSRALERELGELGLRVNELAAQRP